MGIGDDDVPKRLLAEVGAVDENHRDRVGRPGLAHPGTEAAAVELGGDALSTEPIAGVEVEDRLHGCGLGWVDDEPVDSTVDLVAERAGAAGP
nr:hypothetical protein [Phytohabitans suffuscus]